MWKNFWEKKEITKRMKKKNISLILVTVKDIMILDIFFEIKKFIRASWASVITHKVLLHFIILSGCKQPLTNRGWLEMMPISNLDGPTSCKKYLLVFWIHCFLVLNLSCFLSSIRMEQTKEGTGFWCPVFYTDHLFNSEYNLYFS